MADFRRWLIALAVLALFTGLASAQVNSGGGNQAFACSTTNAAVTPQARGEGTTEPLGDIVVACTGGPNPVNGAQIPFANVTVFVNTQVTSRLLGTNSVATASEALLLIDEPGSGLGGYGPAQAQILCNSPGAGCTEYVGNTTTGGASVPVATNPNTSGAPPAGSPQTCVQNPNQTGCTFNATNIAPGANMFQGVVSGNQVTFFGVPVLAPGSTGQRVFRITNLRGNASAITGGGAVPGQITASISFSSASSIPISNPTLVVAFVQQSLATSIRNAGNTGTLTPPSLAQCITTNLGVAILRYSELFGTAFKTRVGVGPNFQANGAAQNIPGNIYNSESMFIQPSVTGNNATAGLADFGTRVKAVFNGIPNGTNIFVSQTNVQSTGLNGGLLGAGSSAILVVGETVPENNGAVPSVASTGTNSTVPVVQLPVVNGSATAVWEITATLPNQLENMDFAVYTTFTASPSTNSPALGTETVNMSYAPTPPAFTAAAGAVASGGLPIPRFVDTSAARNTFTIVICQTDLIFPFITNQAGFDTGIAIANTSTDPFGTAAQVGTCTLNWYGANAPAATVTPSVASGTDYVLLASQTTPNFQGYMIAVCNFQYAHGFAFISDLGARNLAMGYLALVEPTQNVRLLTNALNN